MGFAGVTVLLIAMAAWRQPVIRDTRVLPVVKDEPPVAPAAIGGLQ
jgi:hypothetical protein